MFDFNTLLEFSNRYCLTICAFLVPMNLIATLQTLIMVGLGRPPRQIYIVSGVASSYALLMIFHVLTWFLVGVIMAPTYILVLLATTCLIINGWAMVYPASLKRLLGYLTSTFRQLSTANS